MLEVGIVACLIILTVAGYLAFRNSKLIAEKKQLSHISLPPAEYTLYMAKEFTEEDRRIMVPLGMMEFRDLNGIKIVALCRVIDNNRGDLKLEEAGAILMKHIRQARQKGTFISYRSVQDALQDPTEIQMAERIAEVVSSEEGLSLSTQ
ncbi:hypothetical protein [Paenibacillus sp. GCM10028914]|uniref:hypothetical protein n=1 Tax=Paenibacillus sp. GCM10028914 TaxID=3273416 RepID=UPI003618C4FA